LWEEYYFLYDGSRKICGTVFLGIRVPLRVTPRFPYGFWSSRIASKLVEQRRREEYRERKRQPESGNLMVSRQAIKSFQIIFKISGAASRAFSSTEQEFPTNLSFYIR
jgi:hypothetical protein